MADKQFKLQAIKLRIKTPAGEIRERHFVGEPIISAEEMNSDEWKNHPFAEMLNVEPSHLEFYYPEENRTEIDNPTISQKMTEIQREIIKQAEDNG